MYWIDPECLRETRGTVTQFLLNPFGELDGLLLGNDRQVHFPPHMSRLVAKHVGVGDKLRVRGVKPRTADIMVAVQLTSADGVIILDEGPHHPDEWREKPHAARRAMEVSGEVKATLYGPKGEVCGAVLTDGTSIRMAPHAAEALFEYLEPGAHIQVWGHGVNNRYGRTIEVDDIAKLVDVGHQSATI